MQFEQPIRQIAYYVHDARAAARQHSSLYGSGPFFILGFPPVTLVYRGELAQLNHTCIVGQWGSMQVEFLQQNDDAPSVFHELYPVGSGKTGFHHVAIFVKDVDGTSAFFAKAGYAEASRAKPAKDTTVLMIDMRSACGHFLEVYETSPLLIDLFDTVATSARGFDGSRPLRQLDYQAGVWTEVDQQE